MYYSLVATEAVGKFFIFEESVCAPRVRVRASVLLVLERVLPAVPGPLVKTTMSREKSTRGGETFITELGEGRKTTLKGGLKLRKAKATTLGIVLHARSCAMGGGDVV